MPAIKTNTANPASDARAPCRNRNATWAVTGPNGKAIGHTHACSNVSMGTETNQKNATNGSAIPMRSGLFRRPAPITHMNATMPATGSIPVTSWRGTSRRNHPLRRISLRAMSPVDVPRDHAKSRKWVTAIRNRTAYPAVASELDTWSQRAMNGGVEMNISVIALALHERGNIVSRVKRTISFSAIHRLPPSG